MKKIFISIPESRKHEKNTFLSEVKDYLHDNIQTTETINLSGSEPTPLDHLSEHLKLMNKADYVVMSEGWFEDTMCRIECICAVNYDKKILEIRRGKIHEGLKEEL